MKFHADYRWNIVIRVRIVGITPAWGGAGQHKHEAEHQTAADSQEA